MRLRIYYFTCHNCREAVSTQNVNEPIICGACNTQVTRYNDSSKTTINTTKKEYYPFLGPEPLWLNYSEKKQYLKEHKLMEAGDPIGGSREGVFKKPQ